MPNRRAPAAMASQRAQSSGTNNAPRARSAKGAPVSNKTNDRVVLPKYMNSALTISPATSSVAASQCVPRYMSAWFIRVHPCSSVANSLRSKINPLHAMVLAVDDVHFATAVHGERPGAAEPARLAARPAPGAKRHAVGRELLDP